MKQSKEEQERRYSVSRSSRPGAGEGVDDGLFEVDLTPPNHQRNLTRREVVDEVRNAVKLVVPGLHLGVEARGGMGEGGREGRGKQREGEGRGSGEGGEREGRGKERGEGGRGGGERDECSCIITARA